MSRQILVPTNSVFWIEARIPNGDVFIVKTYWFYRCPLRPGILSRASQSRLVAAVAQLDGAGVS